MSECVHVWELVREVTQCERLESYTLRWERCVRCGMVRCEGAKLASTRDA